MFNPDEFYKSIERHMMVDRLKSTGQMENSFWQHLGRYYNHQNLYVGTVYDEIMGSIERTLTGQKRHGFEQNKKTDLEKLIEKRKEENT